MNKQEAIEAMQNGKKITHRHFDSKEWMTYSDGNILLEDGVKCTPFEFWRWRSDPSWDNDYSLFDKTTV